MPPDSHFEGKVAIVTGAASGIGLALARALVVRGASVVFCDIDEEGARKAADELHAGPPGRASAAGLDVRNSDAVTELVERTARDHGHLDLIFNNAGIAVGGRISDMTLAHFDRAIDVNLRGVINGVMAAYPIMIRQGRGHIVNTASSAGLLPGPGLGPYAMTKHAVVGLSISLRPEAATNGVRVSVVCPGVIDTPLLDRKNPSDLPDVASYSGGGREALEKAMGKAYPAELLARDVLVGVARNRAIIVAPHHARRAWFAYRMAPVLVQRFVDRSFAKMGSRYLGDAAAGTVRASSSESPGA
ncbi:MAG: SDR family oxidoreductase [Acidimicrobiales bacterium]|jgi:NAD(P)-dependent dehydrogenase (short-subunit alcohol dehydrogenase family)